MDVLREINRRMHGDGCPGSGSLGECAVITKQHDSNGTHCTAHLYLWPAAKDLTAKEVAGWFYAVGATEVVISAVLYDPDNAIVEGASTDDGARPWDVSYVMTQNAEVSGAGTASAGLPGYAGDGNGERND